MLKMEGIQTLKGSWPWPWPSIRPYGISSCSSHRPLPIYQISFKLKKLFVDGRTYGRADGRTDGWTDIFPLYTIRSTFGSRPKKWNGPALSLTSCSRTSRQLCVSETAALARIEWWQAFCHDMLTTRCDYSLTNTAATHCPAISSTARHKSSRTNTPLVTSCNSQSVLIEV